MIEVKIKTKGKEKCFIDREAMIIARDKLKALLVKLDLTAIESKTLLRHEIDYINFAQQEGW